jgi:septation ring formation regulator EzrA
MISPAPLEGWLRRNTDITDIQYSDQVTVLFETADDTVPSMIQDLSRGSVSVKDRGIVYREKEINS